MSQTPNLLAQSAQKFATNPVPKIASTTPLPKISALVGTLAPKPFVPNTVTPPSTRTVSQNSTTNPVPSTGSTPVNNSSTANLPLINPNASYQDVTGGLAGTPIKDSTQPVQGLFGSVTSSLAGLGSQTNPMTTEAYNKAQQIQAQLAESKKNQANAEASQLLAPIPIGDATGRQQATRNQYLQQQSALSSELQGESNLAGIGNQTQQIQSGALSNVGGLIAPQLAGFNQQAFNPVTGQFGSGDGTSNSTSALSQLPPQAQSAVQSYAQQVQSGQMTRADAESRLSAYGVAGTNALNEVLGSGFNTNASNASAGTTAQGQQIQTAAHATNSALDTLSNLFSGLNPLQTQGIPATNSLANWIATQFGDQALSQYKTNLSDARSQLIGVLNSAGGTPTGNEATALQYLPDNMTKAQFDANVGTQQNPGIVRQLVAQKVASFTQSGQQNNATTNNSGLFNW